MIFYQNLGMKPQPQKIPKLSCIIGECGPFRNWVLIICELFWEKKDWDATNLSEQAEKKNYLSERPDFTSGHHMAPCQPDFTSATTQVLQDK